jgi:hypothetical protein
MNRAPNTRLQLTGAAQLLQSGRRWRSAFGGLRRPQLKRKPLGPPEGLLVGARI